MTRAVFLDRDGTINAAPPKDGVAQSPRRLEDFHLLPGVTEGITRLKAAGFVLVVITNQPDIKRGGLDIQELDRIHEYLKASLPLDAVLVCPHDDADECACRKPKPGMIFDAAKRFEIDVQASFVVGDMWRDMGAAAAARCRGILINAPYNFEVPCDWRVADLMEAANVILSNS